MKQTREGIQIIIDADYCFSKILKEERERRGLTQAQVAAWSDIPPASISHFEDGSRKPSFTSLIRLADALRVSTDFLLGRDSEKEKIKTCSHCTRKL